MVASPEGASGAGAPKAPSLDTLAQLDQRVVVVDREKLARRARAKYMTEPVAVELAELRSPLEKSYRNTVYCAGTLVQDGDGSCGVTAAGIGGASSAIECGWLGQ